MLLCILTRSLRGLRDRVRISTLRYVYVRYTGSGGSQFDFDARGCGPPPSPRSFERSPRAAGQRRSSTARIVCCLARAAQGGRASGWLTAGYKEAQPPPANAPSNVATPCAPPLPPPPPPPWFFPRPYQTPTATGAPLTGRVRRGRLTSRRPLSRAGMDSRRHRSRAGGRGTRTTRR